jgi:hypothetical protein
MTEIPELGEEQLKALVKNVARTRGQERVPFVDALFLATQAQRAYDAWLPYERAIRGLLSVDVRYGEVRFMAPNEARAQPQTSDRPADSAASDETPRRTAGRPVSD